jgi:hypothetical protein
MISHTKHKFEKGNFNKKCVIVIKHYMPLFLANCDFIGKEVFNVMKFRSESKIDIHDINLLLNNWGVNEVERVYTMIREWEENNLEKNNLFNCNEF